LEPRITIKGEDEDEFNFDAPGLPLAMGGVQQPESDYDDNDEEKEIELKPEDDPSMFYSHGKYHRFSEKSVWVLEKGNPIREGIVWIITHKRFDHVVVGLILFNSLLLGIKDYTDVDNVTQINQFVEKLKSWAWVSYWIEAVT
jgi:hypothetical protein